MTKNDKGQLVLFLVAFTILILGISHLYSSGSVPASKSKENTVSVFKEASIRILSSWGPCPVSDGCRETYELDLDGKIFHNSVASGYIAEDTARELIGFALNLYQSKVCTLIYATDASESYELNIDGKKYQFGDGGCKEMQSIDDIIKNAGKR